MQYLRFSHDLTDEEDGGQTGGGKAGECRGLTPASLMDAPHDALPDRDRVR